MGVESHFRLLYSPLPTTYVESRLGAKEAMKVKVCDTCRYRNEITHCALSKEWLCLDCPRRLDPDPAWGSSYRAYRSFVDKLYRMGDGDEMSVL